MDRTARPLAAPTRRGRADDTPRAGVSEARALDGIAPEEDAGDDFEIWDIAEDDSLVG